MLISLIGKLSDLGARRLFLLMASAGATEAVYYTMPYYFKQIGVVKNVTITGIYIAGNDSQISDTAKSYIRPVLTDYYVYFELGTANTGVINTMKGKLIRFEVTFS